MMQGFKHCRVSCLRGNKANGGTAKKTESGLILPIPEDLAQQSKFGPDSFVSITLENSRFIVADPADPHYTIEELLEGMTEENLHAEITTSGLTGTPRRRSKYTTAELLKGVTDENMHGEIDWGPPVGKEVW